MTAAFDVAIVGAGMAGASLAAEVGAHGRVLLIEAEGQPGYHATGRSAAFWSETYGGPWVQPLTTASRGFLAAPPAEMGGVPFLSPRGELHIADRDGEGALDALLAAFRESSVILDPLGRSALERTVPGLRPGWDRAVAEPTCCDIDVAALHGAYLRLARQRGVRIETDAALVGARREGGRWSLETRAGAFAADILVNAAGAWADPVALIAGERPLGIRPYRRTMIQLAVDPPVPADLPLIVDARARFYFKPESGGRLWLSPHDETESDPCDAAPEELDVALAIDRLEQAVDWRILKVERRWAGLRSFAPDRRPVYGYAPGGCGFFWYAGQGGFGIQTAPAAARLAAALLLRQSADQMVGNIDPEPYAPSRFD